MINVAIRRVLPVVLAAPLCFVQVGAAQAAQGSLDVRPTTRDITLSADEYQRIQSIAQGHNFEKNLNGNSQTTNARWKTWVFKKLIRGLRSSKADSVINKMRFLDAKAKKISFASDIKSPTPLNRSNGGLALARQPLEVNSQGFSSQFSGEERLKSSLMLWLSSFSDRSNALNPHGVNAQDKESVCRNLRI